MFVILSISDSDKHFSPAIEEYGKRLGKSLHIENIKPYKGDTPQLIIKKETEIIMEILLKKYASYEKFLLNKEGKPLNTLELSKTISHKDCVFMIGWPYGVDRELMIQSIPWLKEISFGKITLPHGLAKLTLLEQLYRCHTIAIWKTYHY